LTDENSGGKQPLSESIKQELENGLIRLNPPIIGHPATNPQTEENWPHASRHELLQPLFVEALVRKCA
jgi:hypothetical protein